MYVCMYVCMYACMHACIRRLELGSSVKQKSQHRTQSKLTLVFATHHSNAVTETVHVPSEMNGTEIPLNLVNMYGA